DTNITPGFNAELHNGWNKYGAFSERGLTSSATMPQMITAMADKSSYTFAINTSNLGNLDITSDFSFSNSGTLEIVRLSSSRAYATAISTTGVILHGIFG